MNRLVSLYNNHQSCVSSVAEGEIEISVGSLDGNGLLRFLCGTQRDHKVAPKEPVRQSVNHQGQYCEEHQTFKTFLDLMCIDQISTVVPLKR